MQKKVKIFYKKITKNICWSQSFNLKTKNIFLFNLVNILIINNIILKPGVAFNESLIGMSLKYLLRREAVFFN